MKDRTPKKGITLPNGNRLSHGQLFPRKEEPMSDDKMQRNAMQRLMDRRAAPKDAFGNAIGRDGRVPKRLTDPAPVHGQTRREEKGGHPLLPNAKRPLDDEPLQKSWQDKGNVPTHPGTPKAGSGYAHDPQL